MNIVLLGKFLIAGGTIAVPAVGYVLWNKYFNNDQWPYVYVVVESVSGATEGASTSDFKCKLEGSTTTPAPFKCKVEQLTWNGNKNHLDYSSIATTETTESAIKVDNNVFKITVPQEQYESVKNTDKKIEISYTTKENKENLTANAKILFTVDADGKTFNGKAEYFLAKAPKPTNLTSLTAQETYQCAWEKDQATNFKACEIYDFASTDNASGSYSELTFQTPQTKSTAVTANKHYLIKAASPTDNNLDKKQIVFIKKGGDSSSESVTFSGIQASFLIEDKLLILGSQS